MVSGNNSVILNELPQTDVELTFTNRLLNGENRLLVHENLEEIPDLVREIRDLGYQHQPGAEPFPISCNDLSSFKTARLISQSTLFYSSSI